MSKLREVADEGTPVSEEAQNDDVQVGSSRFKLEFRRFFKDKKRQFWLQRGASAFRLRPLFFVRTETRRDVK